MTSATSWDPPSPRRRRKFTRASLFLFLIIGIYIILSVGSLVVSMYLDQRPSPSLTFQGVPTHLGSRESNALREKYPIHATQGRQTSRNRTRHVSPRTKTEIQFAGTFVIQVRGEMGNHLQKIAHGHALQWYAQEERFGFSPQLLVRHLKKPKWKIARSDIHQCFPKLRHLDYEGAMQPSFLKIQQDHPPWLANQHPKSLAEEIAHVKDETHANITRGLSAMKQLIMAPNRKYPDYPIVVLGGPMRNALIDKYYQRFRDELFLFDDDCCAQLPEPDEVVFHFRHFAKELSVEEQQFRGFEELDPQRVASQLMGHLPLGQKIAITTRFHNDPIVLEYQKAMLQRNLQVRLVANQTGVQDFCFLLKARQELIGVAKSTYARWAAYLGDAERVQLYALENVGSQEFTRQTMQFPWTHPELKQRIHFPVFPSSSSHK